MGDALSDSFRLDLRCAPETADDLARRAREHIARVLRSTEDSDGDLVRRLQDPRVFGEFAESMLSDRMLPEAVRMAAIERTFDLLPLPRTEGEVILVDTRGPPRLLALASFLAERDALTVLHAMHLVYAVFLDRTLVLSVPRTTRSRVLSCILALPEASEGLRLLYLALHLGAIPEAEAHGELQSLFRARSVSAAFKQTAAAVVSAEDGGVGALKDLAQAEGLLPPDLGDADAPGVVANIPRMPARLAPAGRRWLSHHGAERGERGGGGT